MGIKRLGRKRLAAIEKLGILKDVSASEAMKAAIVSATQHRQGQQVITDIVLDLAKAGSSLLTKATADGVAVAASSGNGAICQITDSVFGIVTAVDTICLEGISDGTLVDYDLIEGSAAGGTLGVAPGGTPASVHANIGVLGKHSTKAYDDHAAGLKDRFLYLTAGAATGQKASATIDCGDAVIANIVSGITRIRLAQDDGNTIDIVADSSKNKASTTDGFFGISDVSTTAHLAESLAAGIGGTDGGSGDYTTSSPTTTTVLITHAASTVTNNGTNFLVDDPEKASGIVVPSFSGGIDSGVAITSGKLLIRVTGFVAFDDV